MKITEFQLASSSSSSSSAKKWPFFWAEGDWISADNEVFPSFCFDLTLVNRDWAKGCAAMTERRFIFVKIGFFSGELFKHPFFCAVGEHIRSFKEVFPSSCFCFRLFIRDSPYGCAATTERRLAFFIKGDFVKGDFFKGDFMKFGKKGERRGEDGTRCVLSVSDPESKSGSGLDSDSGRRSTLSLNPRSKLASSSIWLKSTSSTSKGRLGLAMTSGRIDWMKNHFLHTGMDRNRLKF